MMKGGVVPGGNVRTMGCDIAVTCAIALANCTP